MMGLIETEEEITEGKIYSPVGKFAERAKLANSNVRVATVAHLMSTLLICFRCKSVNADIG